MSAEQKGTDAQAATQAEATVSSCPCAPAHITCRAVGCRADGRTARADWPDRRTPDRPDHGHMGSTKHAARPQARTPQ